MLDQKLLRKRIDELHPLSESSRAILELLGEPDHSARDLVRVIECDGPLTIRVLNVVNSAAFSVPVKIEALDHAVVYLGMQDVVTIALSHSASELFGNERSQSGSDLWKDAIETAIAARLIGQKTDLPLKPALAFTGGLLRDIGKTVLWEFISGEIDALNDCMASGSARDICEAERELTGTDHCEVGTQIAEHFQLTPRLIEVIRHHHKPDLADPSAQAFVDLVHLADAITRERSKAESDDEPLLNLNLSSARRVGFELADVEALCVELSDENKSAQALLNMDRGSA